VQPELLDRFAALAGRNTTARFHIQTQAAATEVKAQILQTAALLHHLLNLEEGEVPAVAQGQQSHVSDELLALLAELCSSLSHLTVSCDYLEGLNGGEDVPTFEGLLRLLTLLPTLTQLSLSGCVFSGRMVRMEWKGLAAKLPVLKLQQVTFVGVPPRLTAEQILELVRRCPELRQLGVKSSWGGSHLAEQLTDSWLGEVVRACPQLSRLDLGKGIDDCSVVRIRADGEPRLI